MEETLPGRVERWIPTRPLTPVPGEPLICPQCRSETPTDARFCTNCGAPLVVAGASGTGSPVPSPVEDDDDEEDTVDELEESTDPDGETTTIPAGPADLRECPNCGAPNSRRRSLCGRCGADLGTGEMRSPRPATVGAEPEQDAASGRIDGDRPRTGRVVALVVVVGVLLGALIGGLIALDTGPFGDDGAEAEIPEAPPFDPARYEEDPEPLTITAIGTTTTHEPLGDETYDAAQMVDRDLATAWNNAGARNAAGVGEVIAVEFDGPVWVDEVVLGNGTQASDAAFLGNARIQRARLRFDGGTVYEVTFLDQPGLQVVELPAPVLTTGAMVDVLAAYPGDTYEDLAVAELRFVGWSAVGADRDAAADRAED